jgi:hypothetical protein
VVVTWRGRGGERGGGVRTRGGESDGRWSWLGFGGGVGGGVGDDERLFKNYFKKLVCIILLTFSRCHENYFNIF